jgi:hypothetical protein
MQGEQTQILRLRYASLRFAQDDNQSLLDGVLPGSSFTFAAVGDESPTYQSCPDTKPLEISAERSFSAACQAAPFQNIDLIRGPLNALLAAEAVCLLEFVAKFRRAEVFAQMGEALLEGF